MNKMIIWIIALLSISLFSINISSAVYLIDNQVTDINGNAITTGDAMSLHNFTMVGTAGIYNYTASYGNSIQYYGQQGTTGGVEGYLKMNTLGLDLNGSWTFIADTKIQSLSLYGSSNFCVGMDVSSLTSTATYSCLRYSGSAYSNYWQYSYDNGTGRIITDTSVARTAGNWYQLKIAYDGTSNLSMWINDTFVGEIAWNDSVSGTTNNQMTLRAYGHSVSSDYNTYAYFKNIIACNNFGSCPIKTVNFQMLNAFDNSLIQNFTINAFNGTASFSKITTNGNAYIDLTEGIWTYNATIPNFYQNTIPNSNINVTSNNIRWFNYSIQSLFNVSLHEIITNISLSNFNASTLYSFNSTSGSSLLLITNNAQQEITAEKTGYLPANIIATATGGQIIPFNISIGTNILNINATNNGIPVNSFSIFLNSSNYSYVVNRTTTNNNINFSLLHGNYNIVISSSNFSVERAFINANSSELYINYTFNLQTKNSVIGNFLDEETHLTIDNVSMQFISDIYSTNSSTTNGSIFTSLLTPTNYNLRYFSDGYVTRSYFMTVTDNSFLNLSLYMLKNTSSTEITINVYDQNNIGMGGVTVEALRYYQPTNSYSIVEMTTTDNGGTGYLHLQLNEEYYKFIAIRNNKVLLISPSQYIISPIINLQISLYGMGGESINKYYTTYGTISFTDATNTFSYTYLDTSNTASKGCLYIYKLSNISKNIYNSSCLNTFSGTILMSVDNSTNATYEADGFVYYGSNYIFTDSKQISFNIVEQQDRKSTRLNSSHIPLSRMPSSA